MQLSGTVTSGLGRAHVFMAQSHYQEQFKSIIGRSAWPGTLNVHVEGESLREYKKLRVSAGLEEGESSGVTAHRIKGFDRDGVLLVEQLHSLANFLPVKILTTVLF